MVDLLKSDAPRKAMAMMLALATALGPISIPALAAGKPAPDADPATTIPAVSRNFSRHRAHLR